MEEFTHKDNGADVDHLTTKILAQWSEPRCFGHQTGPMGLRSSPESSPCSTCSSSEGQCDSSQVFMDFSYNFSRMDDAQAKTSRPKMSTKRRMKASEREKMRMRSLAEALHQLRDYLPPIYSRRGQPLTKIQTLKYTIEYIKTLSDILSQE